MSKKRITTSNRAKLLQLEAKYKLASKALRKAIAKRWPEGNRVYVYLNDRQESGTNVATRILKLVF